MFSKHSKSNINNMILNGCKVIVNSTWYRPDLVVFIQSGAVESDGD